MARPGPLPSQYGQAMARPSPQVCAEPARLADAAAGAGRRVRTLRLATETYHRDLGRLAGADASGVTPPNRTWQVEEACANLESLGEGLRVFAAGVAATDAAPRTPAQRAVRSAQLGVEITDATTTTVHGLIDSEGPGPPRWHLSPQDGTGRPMVAAATAGRAATRVARVSGPAGIALAGASQYADDATDPSLTEGDRIARAGAATVADGGIGAAGSATFGIVGKATGVKLGGLAGVKLGAAAGTVAFPIAGTIAGAALGGILGAAAGSLLRRTADPAIRQAGAGVDRRLADWRARPAEPHPEGLAAARRRSGGPGP